MVRCYRTAHATQAYCFLQLLLANTLYVESLVDKVRLILDRNPDYRDLPDSGAPLLELCLVGGGVSMFKRERLYDTYFKRVVILFESYLST